MHWTAITEQMQRWNDRTSAWRQRMRRIRRRLALFLAIVGPGLITANVDNDAGGMCTYSLAGA